MKIVLIVPSLARKGPVIVARDIAQGLVDSGHHVDVWYLDNKVELDFPCPTRLFRWTDLRDLVEVDVVHSHSLRPDALAWFLRKLPIFKAVFISTIHNYVEQDLSYAYGKVTSWIFSRIWRMFWSGLDACVVLTFDARAYYLKKQPNLHLHVIYNGRHEHIPSAIDQEDYVLIQELRQRFCIIGASAAVVRVKGFDQVINALPGLPSHLFLLIGSGPALTELIDLAHELGVADRFVPLGFRSNARDYLASMDIYAMPSHSEGMPLAMLEAVYARVPIVCSDIPVFREVFSADEVTFFALRDVASFTAAVGQAKVESAERSEKARMRFDRSYSTTAMTKNYLDFYRSLA